jgi:hypothetical protein
LLNYQSIIPTRSKVTPENIHPFLKVYVVKFFPSWQFEMSQVN